MAYIQNHTMEQIKCKVEFWIPEPVLARIEMTAANLETSIEDLMAHALEVYYGNTPVSTQPDTYPQA
ncbi:Hypothetical protein PYTT_2574 [Akkermansia glycaniphila]|uniref:Uncharacterized protein n=2 Tax=Akkermansia glycaniphila TaxID=1679444 RepID=A0A1C7PCD9_9BACT|nr:hypothetical protein AC781_05850 [Akkermansia glycaniphila]SEI01447.1 Hypothetical protein PYTT_2574 [Akkermansia glycaniphila]